MVFSFSFRFPEASEFESTVLVSRWGRTPPRLAFQPDHARHHQYGMLGPPVTILSVNPEENYFNNLTSLLSPDPFAGMRLSGSDGQPWTMTNGMERTRVIIDYEAVQRGYRGCRDGCQGADTRVSVWRPMGNANKSNSITCA